MCAMFWLSEFYLAQTCSTRVRMRARGTRRRHLGAFSAFSRVAAAVGGLIIGFINSLHLALVPQARLEHR